MKNLPFYLPLAVLMLIHGYLTSTELYLSTDIDVPMHYFGGAFLCLALIRMLDLTLFKTMDLSRGLFILIHFSLVTTFAVLWEFYEYLSCQFVDCMLLETYEDTLLDLAVGMAGALSALTLYTWLTNRSGWTLAGTKPR